MMQESRMETTPNRFVPTETECKVADTTTDLAARACTLDLTSCIDEVKCIVVVLSEAGANGENIGVKDDVLWVHPNLLHEGLVSTKVAALPDRPDKTRLDHHVSQ